MKLQDTLPPCGMLELRSQMPVWAFDLDGKDLLDVSLTWQPHRGNKVTAAVRLSCGSTEYHLVTASFRERFDADDPDCANDMLRCFHDSLFPKAPAVRERMKEILERGMEDDKRYRQEYGLLHVPPLYPGYAMERAAFMRIPAREYGIRDHSHFDMKVVIAGTWRKQGTAWLEYLIREAEYETDFHLLRQVTFSPQKVSLASIPFYLRSEAFQEKVRSFDASFRKQCGITSFGAKLEPLDGEYDPERARLEALLGPIEGIRSRQKRLMRMKELNTGS